MKKFFPLLLFIVYSSIGFGQQSITSGGGSFTSDEVVFHFTVGEAFNQVYQDENKSMSYKEGFLPVVQIEYLLSVFEQTYNVTVYPNPFYNELHFDMQKQPLKIEFFNSQGKLVRGVPFHPTIDVSDLPSGLYSIRLYYTNEREYQTLKIIKQ